MLGKKERQNGKLGRRSMVNLESTYSGKKVFITGQTGFKGSWLLKWLHILGAQIKGYALSPQTDKDHFNQLAGEKLCDSVIADIRDKEKLEREIVAFQPDFIFHLAAQPLVRVSYEYPDDTFEVNGMGTSYLLSAVRKLDKPCSVILITTDKVYENKEWIYPYRENDRLGGHDPYSASKTVSEIIIASFSKSFFSFEKYSEHRKVLAIARAGNVIGGGDWSKDRIVPDIIRALIAKKVIQVRNPLAVRPWQHVLEPTGAYLLLGKKMSENPHLSGSAWNIGPRQDDHLTVEQLVSLAIKSWGSGSFETPRLKDQPHEAGLLKLDISKTAKELPWQPKLNSKEAILWTIDWYQNSSANALNFSENQIRKYIALPHPL